MSQRVASLYAELSVDATKLDAGLKKGKEGLAGLKDGAAHTIESLTGLSVGSLGAAAAVGALAAGLNYSIDAAAEAEKIDAQLNAVLQSTGGAAGLTADELNNMASKLSMMSAVEDDAIKSGEALMLTFTGIGKETFPGAMEAALDMSAALGQDLKSSILQVGKALNDPSGMGAMKRVGVSFTDAQIEMGKALFETGKKVEYQQLVMAELNKEFGGSAAAAADTYAGKVQKLQNSVGNLGEAFGGVLLPPLTEAIENLDLFITRHERATAGFEEQKAAVYEAAKTYEEYSAGVIKAGEETGKLQIDLATAEFEGMGVAVEEAHRQIGILSEAEWEAAQNMDRIAQSGMVASLYAIRPAAEDAGLSVEDLGDKVDLFKSAISGQFGKEADNFKGKLEDLKSKSTELKTKIAELEGKSWLTAEQKENLSELKTKLDENGAAAQTLAEEHERAMRSMAFNMIQQRADSDGLTQNEVENLSTIAKEWGLWDQKTADVISSINENIGLLETDRPEQFRSIIQAILDMPSTKEFTFKVNVEGDEIPDWANDPQDPGKRPACFVGGTPVNTPEGLRSIGELQAGDRVLVLTDSGVNTASVIRVITARRDDLVTVTISDGQDFRCSPDHPWKTARGFVHAAELADGDDLAGLTNGLQVRSVTPCPGSYQVYDLNISHPDHTFMVGGCVVHNKEADGLVAAMATGSSGGINITGPVNVYGVTDLQSLMREIGHEVQTGLVSGGAYRMGL
jgi:predicted transcriptional regulator